MTIQGGTAWRPDLHVRLARRYVMDVRAKRATAFGLAVSLLAWTLGLDVAAHGALMVIAAVVGAALPVRPPLERAFAWIGHEAGLAYQTHVEHGGGSDPFGLLAEAAVQARLTVRGVAPPPHSPWWLPLAATAIAVWLIAAVVGGLPGLTGFGGGGAPGSAPDPAPPASPAPFSESIADDEPDGVDEDAEEPGAPSPPADPGDGVGDEGDTPRSEGTEGETVERFLENLRERPVVEERPTGVDRDVRRDGVLEDERAAEPVDGPRDAGAEAEGTLRPQPGDQQEADDTAEDEVLGRGDGEGPDGVEEAEDGDEPGAGDDEGDEPGAGDPTDDEEGAADAGAADAGAAEMGDAEALGPDGATEDEFGFEAGDGQDAGVGAGAADETEAVELGPEGDLEALPGMLLPGAETPGGRVRLPGRDDGHVPEGRSVEGYERAVEQAVTDGTVPVPYQEIIRNYFR